MTNQARVLIADDNRLNRMKLAHGIQQQGCLTEAVEDGRQALEALHSGPFDLVLLDILMPEFDGYQVLQTIKDDPDLRSIPVIVISAVDNMESVVKCIQMGAEDYLLKPFDPVLLNARVGASLEKKRLRNQELEYLKQVERLTQAAAAVEAGQFEPAVLDEVGARPDALGQLARVFQTMARQVQAREQTLQHQVHQLQIELNEVRQRRQVAEITETVYFQELQAKSKQLRELIDGKTQERGT